MSRIGRLPVTVPPKVEVHIAGNNIKVNGPKGNLEYTFPQDITFTLENGVIIVKRPSDDATHRALHGTTRALIHNMVTGVSIGFERVLEINGVGYRAELDGKKLVLSLGYSHPIVIEPPAGITFETDPKTRQIKVSGPDKQKVGQMADFIRKQRPPEPYLGKGIKYIEEKIRRKAGKSGKG
jgi:large subunit ribosomal protein L6